MSSSRPPAPVGPPPGKAPSTVKPRPPNAPPPSKSPTIVAKPRPPAGRPPRGTLKKSQLKQIAKALRSSSDVQPSSTATPTPPPPAQRKLPDFEHSHSEHSHFAATKSNHSRVTAAARSTAPGFHRSASVRTGSSMFDPLMLVGPVSFGPTSLGEQLDDDDGDDDDKIVVKPAPRLPVFFPVKQKLPPVHIPPPIYFAKKKHPAVLSPPLGARDALPKDQFQRLSTSPVHDSLSRPKPKAPSHERSASESGLTRPQISQPVRHWNSQDELHSRSASSHPPTSDPVRRAQSLHRAQPFYHAPSTIPEPPEVSAPPAPSPPHGSRPPRPTSNHCSEHTNSTSPSGSPPRRSPTQPSEPPMVSWSTGMSPTNRDRGKSSGRLVINPSRSQRMLRRRGPPAPKNLTPKFGKSIGGDTQQAVSNHTSSFRPPPPAAEVRWQDVCAVPDERQYHGKSSQRKRLFVFLCPKRTSFVCVVCFARCRVVFVCV